MRLICPNCAAQYEIDAAMIPDEGRDVQCSSCGHTWFQQPESPPPLSGDAVPQPPAPEAPPPLPPAEEEPETAAPAPAPKARPIDRAALEILRQEAARESEARRRDTGNSLESQPDLGLDDGGSAAQSRAAAAKARLARLREAPDGPPATPPPPETRAESAATAPVTAPRRELLPDIEEINSTLTPTGERDTRSSVEEVAEATEARRGFRTGFFGVCALFVVLIAVYMLAPRLAQAAPALTPMLAGYLDAANGLLDLIDRGLRAAIEMMNQ